jgi:hypothetical protein
MAIGDLERLVSDAKKNKQLVSHFALLGHDSGAFVSVANRLGYKITDADVNTYLAQKCAPPVRQTHNNSRTGRRQTSKRSRPPCITPTCDIC